MINRRNIEWVNTLKTIGIFAVILGHLSSPLSIFIFSWHMPLFFILAGFFIKDELSFEEVFIKDFKRLMIPYFIFAIIGLCVEVIKRILLHRDSLNYVYELQSIFLGMDMRSLNHHYGFVLWFLPTLFFARLIVYGFQKKAFNIVFQFILVLILFYISFYLELPFAIDNAFNASLWVFLGFIFYKFYQENTFLYGFPAIGIMIFLFYGIPALDMATKSYSHSVVNILWAISIIFIFIMILKKINFSAKISHVLSLWGGNTMLLFIIHPYTNNIASILGDKLHFGDWYLKYFISLCLLQILLFIKIKFSNRGIFKYV